MTMADRAAHLEIEWAGEKLALLPERALWWPAARTLFIADTHFGKASAFRTAGLAVPETTHDSDIARLDRALCLSGAQRLVILGDFLHAPAARNATVLGALQAWRQRHEGLEVILVPGNHDRRAGLPPAELEISCEEAPWRLPPFVCLHEPADHTDGFALAGHWHPGFRLSDRVGTGISSPCFCFARRLAVLPAFGEFTGLRQVHPGDGDRFFVVGSDEVVAVRTV